MSEHLCRALTFHNIEESITAYHFVIEAGIAHNKECFSNDKAFHVKISYEVSPVHLPGYIDKAAGSKITNSCLLENLPNYCRNVTSYQLLKKYIPLPSQFQLRSLKSPSIDNGKAHRRRYFWYPFKIWGGQKKYISLPHY